MQNTAVRKTWLNILLLSLLALMEFGCVSVISPRIRQEADRSLPFEQLRARPDVYAGRLVIVGGEIVRTTHVPGVIFLEVMQRPVDDEDTPIVTGQSEGRFMVRCTQYLDPFVYTIGQIVTVAGRVLGTHAEKVGDTDMVYPLLACVEIYAWSPSVAAIPVYPGVWYWWGRDPWYWDPWYWHYPRPYFRWRRPSPRAR